MVIFLTGSVLIYYYYYYYYYFRGFFVFIIVLLILVCAFRRLSLFTFYLFFERRLIPALFLILGWGYEPAVIPWFKK